MFSGFNKSSFCSYRWDYLQVNIEQSQVRNCCQCPPIDVPQNELNNPDYLINSPYILKRRKELLRNSRHADCVKCWKSENRGGASMRSTSMSKVNFLEINKDPEFSSSLFRRHPDQRSRTIKTLEISMGNLCNLKCHYCTPVFSSAWEREAKSHSLSPTIPIPKVSEEEQNQIISNTLSLFEKHYNTVEKIIFIGGEPLLNPNIYPMLERVVEIAQGKKKSGSTHRAELQIVTNLSIPDKNLDRFLDLSKELIKSFKINISASIDNTGPKAEYIRTGLNWEHFEKNVHKVLSCPSISWLSFHTTLSILNTTSMIDIIKISKELFDYYGKPVPLMDNMVTIPTHLSPLILTPDFAPYLHECSSYVANEILPREPRFKAFVDFTQGAANALRHEKERSRTRNERKYFVRWIEFYDKIRKTSFLQTFPEYKDFFNHCSSL